MKRQILHFAISVLALSVLMQGAIQAEKTLAEIYRSGIVRFLPELTINDDAMPKDMFFESAIDSVSDKDGYVYILDYRANNIKKFDASGKYAATIGRKGQGPGEFNMPFGMTVANDRLIIWDMGNIRLSTFSLEGEFIKSVKILRSEGIPQKMRALPSGNIVIEKEIIFFGESDKPQECLIEVYSPDLEKLKAVYTQEVWRNKYMRLEGMFSNIIQPFSPLVYWDASPDGKIVIGFSKEYKIEFHDSQKGIVSSFTHSYRPVRVNDKDKEKFFAGMSYTTSGGGVTQGAPDHIVKNTHFPKTKPAFQQIVVDSEGNILVRVYHENREEERKLFDAFDSEGKFIGIVQIKGEVIFPYRTVIQDRTFWLPQADEEGLYKIVKYRISE